jgi:lysyl-tRNA synthetase class II
MSSLNRYTLLLLLVGSLFFGGQGTLMAQGGTPSTQKPAKTTTVNTVAKPIASPVELVKNPQKYLKQSVRFEGVVSGFSSLGLDYKPALRDSKNHVGLLVYRSDVWPKYKIPLSELKLFLKRTANQKLPDLNQNDVVSLEGTLFSTALGDAWVDITSYKLLQKAKQPLEE